MWRIFTQALARRQFRVKPASKLAAIVVPLSLRTELSPDEEISLRHLRHFFAGYDKYGIAPAGLQVHLPDLKIKYFPRKFFGSAVAHNRLTYSPLFYRAFSDYKFILFYHLDSLAFSDQLPYWCNTDLDYIGAPWLQCPDTPWVDRPRVGNGGFALLRVEAALNVLANRYKLEPVRYWLDLIDRNARLFQPVVRLLRKTKHCLPKSDVVGRLRNEWSRIEKPTEHGLNNDLFWSDEAVRYFPGFKVASLEEGVRFAFEAAPRTCYEMNGHELPFGCHAWARFDRSFWEPHLLKSEATKSEYSTHALCR